jgi:putative ABC transport system permease protein
MRTLLRRIAGLLHPDARIDDEVRTHLDLLAADYERDGLSPEEARFAARRAFGGVEPMKERYRDRCGLPWVEEFSRDLRYAFRALRRSSGFAAVVVLTLALGVGLNTAIFSLVYNALLRPLPYREVERLVSITAANLETGARDKVSGADLADWRNRTSLFEDFATYWDASFTVPGDTPLTIPSWEVSANLFTLLGARPLLGRTLIPEDGRPDSPRVVVLSHRLWVQRYAASPEAIGQRVLLQRGDAVDAPEASYEIVGVMPPDFAHPSPTAALWTPLKSDLSQNRQVPVFHVIARLHPDVSTTRADRELKQIAAVLAREHPETNARRTATVRDIREIYAGDVKVSLWALQGAALALLLIAALNITNLVLARATVRQRQVAIRLAIGATRWQIFRQSLAEALLVAGSGSLAGLLLAVSSVELLPRLLRSQLANVRLPDTPAGWMTPVVVGAVAAITLLIGLVLAVVAAARRGRIAALIVQAGPGAGSSPWGNRARAAFIVGQVALSVCLLIAAGLLGRSFAKLQDRSLGFRTESILSGFFVLPMDRYRDQSQRELFLRQARQRLRTMPGIEDAAAISTLPLSGADARRPYAIPGRASRRDEWTQYRVVTPEYFQVMEIPLRRGRRFDDRDRAGGVQVAIVNETLARTLWPGENPVGKTIFVADLAPPAQPREIIGVVGDVRHNGPAADIPLEIYRPASQTSWPFFSLVVRTAGEPRQAIPSVEAAVASLDRTVTFGGGVRPFEDLAVASVGMRRASTTLVSLFAACGLILAIVGAYSLVSYVVAQRTREFGIRLAFGASDGDIYTSVFRHGLPSLSLGIAAGTAGALAVTRFVQSLLFEVTPYDPLTFFVTSVMFFAVGSIAMLVPARRAALIDAAVTLRSE